MMTDPLQKILANLQKRSIAVADNRADRRPENISLILCGLVGAMAELVGRVPPEVEPEEPAPAKTLQPFTVVRDGSTVFEINEQIDTLLTVKAIVDSLISDAQRQREKLVRKLEDT